MTSDYLIQNVLNLIYEKRPTDQRYNHLKREAASRKPSQSLRNVALAIYIVVPIFD